MTQHTRKYLIAILILSVLLRVAIALYLGNEVDAPALLTDQRSYHGLGVRLSAGYGFSFDRDWYPFTLAETPTAHWSFLYSLFVAAVYTLWGAAPLAVRLVQAMLGGLLLPWMVFRLARTMFSDATPENAVQAEKVALVAAFIVAIYGYFILYAATLMTETFYIVALLWSLERGLALAAQLRDPASIRSLFPTVLALGVSLGIATLLRQSILPWVPVLFLYLLWLGWRKGQLQTAVVTLGLVGLILVAFVVPWTIRNYIVYDEFLLLNSNAGFAMYSAQHPMHGTTFSEFAAAPLPDGSWGQSEPALDRALMVQGIQFILDDPGRYLLLSLSRIRAFFEFWPTSDTTLLHNIGRTGSFGLFLPFMVYGLILAIRRPRFVQRNVLLFLFAGTYTLMHILTWAMVRYRLPVDAVMIPLAALALMDLVQRARTAIAQHTT